MKKTLLLFLTVFIFSFTFFIRWEKNNSTANFEPKAPTQGDHDNPYAASEFRYKMIVGNHHSYDPLSRIRAIDYTRRKLMAKQGFNNAQLISTWNDIGPGNIGGRIRSILVRPSNPNEILIGAVSGGIWKSTDGGNSWTPKTDNSNPIAISCMTNNGDTVYAGTGEGWFNLDAVYGGGIYKSTDFGNTWTLLPSTTTGVAIWNFRNTMKISIDQNNNIYAATFAYNFKDNVGKYFINGGLYKSSDGGNSWTKISPLSASSDYYTPCDVIAINSSDILLATRSSGTNSGGIYQSTDGGASWNQVTSSLPTSGVDRIALTQDPSNPNTVYAVVSSTDHTASGDAGLKGIYKSTDGGTTWAALSKPQKISSTSNLSYLGSQGWYGNVIGIDPNNSKNIYVGGVDMMKSTDGGSTWAQLTFWDSFFGGPVIHADHHAITFVPGKSGLVYCGDDGGIQKSTDGGKTWTSLNNGLEITQFYSGAVFPSGSIYYGGAQDNGHLLYNGTGKYWKQVVGGDGGYAAIDQTNSNIAYEEYIYLQISKTINGVDWFSATTGLTDAGNANAALFIAPFSLDPENSNVMIAGSNRVWISTDGDNHWPDSSAVLDTAFGNLSAVTIVNSSSPFLAFAGSENGMIFKSNISGNNNTWTSITPPNNNGAYVRRIVVDLNNKQNIYACYSGYNDDGQSPSRHIFFSSDQGSTWTDISGDLPDVPVHTLVIDPSNSQILYIGTETGVYQTTNHGVNWVNVSGNGMPSFVPVDELVLQKQTGQLYAFTHGRSVFVTAIPTSVVEKNNLPQNYSLSQNYPNPFNPTTTIEYSLPQRSQVILKLYDVAGREVKTLVNQEQNSGNHSAVLNASNLASGVYFYRITAGNFVDIKKLVLLK